MPKQPKKVDVDDPMFGYCFMTSSESECNDVADSAVRQIRSQSNGQAQKQAAADRDKSMDDESSENLDVPLSVFCHESAELKVKKRQPSAQRQSLSPPKVTARRSNRYEDDYSSGEEWTSNKAIKDIWSERRKSTKKKAIKKRDSKKPKNRDESISSIIFEKFGLKEKIRETHLPSGYCTDVEKPMLQRKNETIYPRRRTLSERHEDFDDEWEPTKKLPKRARKTKIGDDTRKKRKKAIPKLQGLPFDPAKISLAEPYRNIEPTVFPKEATSRKEKKKVDNENIRPVVLDPEKKVVEAVAVEDDAMPCENEELEKIIRSPEDFINAKFWETDGFDNSEDIALDKIVEDPVMFGVEQKMAEAVLEAQEKACGLPFWDGMTFWELPQLTAGDTDLVLEEASHERDDGSVPFSPHSCDEFQMQNI